MTPKEMQAVAKRDQTWAWMAEHQSELERVIEAGIQSKADIIIAGMACMAVLAELYMRSAGLVHEETATDPPQSPSNDSEVQGHTDSP